MVLSPYAMPGTDLAYCAQRMKHKEKCTGPLPTGLRYLPMRALRYAQNWLAHCLRTQYKLPEYGLRTLTRLWAGVCPTHTEPSALPLRIKWRLFACIVPTPFRPPLSLIHISEPTRPRLI
eukprot:3935039-Rhodomonas_salina.1